MIASMSSSRAKRIAVARRPSATFNAGMFVLGIAVVPVIALYQLPNVQHDLARSPSTVQ